MKNKRSILILLSLILLFSTLPLTSLAANGTPHVGDIIGAAYYSDIRAFINNNEIASFNIYGNTAICVEDLAYYHYPVVWDGEKRTISVSPRNESAYVENAFVYHPSEDEIGVDGYNVLYSDIRTYISGKLVESFNIGGQTMIYMDSLAPYGNLSWDANARTITLYTNSYKPMQKLYDKYSGRLTYWGEMQNNRKHGFGISYGTDGEPEYIGGYYLDKKWGYGETYSYSEEYHGYFINDLRDGQGFLYSYDKMKYYGDWELDKRSGYGVSFNYNEDIEYEGDWVNDKREGKGISYFNSGNTQYDGEWANDKYDGYGTLYDDYGYVVFQGNFAGGAKLIR